MPKAAVGQRQPVREERFVPGIHSVQGINSNVEDIKLRGESMIAKIGPVIVEAVLIRKIVGASELTLTVLDPLPQRRLLQSSLLEEAHELTLDGLRWKLVKVGSEGQGEPLTLTYEPLIVWLLKHLFGPHKAFRDKQTRAEFAQARAFEAAIRARFVSPELHVVQAIASAEDGKRAKKKAEESRGKGVGEQVDLEVNTYPATKAQANVIDRMLRVAESKSAPNRVMQALVAAVIVESAAGRLSDNLLQIIPGTAAQSGIDVTSPEQSAGGFLNGYGPGTTGALAYYRQNPDAAFYEIAQAVQASGAGDASAGKENYGKFGQEAAEWTEAYGGGAEVGTTDFKRYAFQQPKEESNWHCMVRLATEVHWRCFESAAWIYFLDEATLLRSPRRMRVSDVAPGIIDTTFDYDVGKEVTEVTVEAIANVWAAPPGSVADVTRHGPANGLYIVEQIESKPSSRKGIVQVTLRRPTEELKEPSPAASRGSVGFSGAAAGAPAKVQTIISTIDAFEAARTSYLWGGGHGSFASPTERVDCSGFWSAVLHAAGYLDQPITSNVFASVLEGGVGEWVTIYGDGEHVLGKVKYPDGNWRWAGTSSENPGGGPGWISDSAGESGARSHPNASHPRGL